MARFRPGDCAIDGATDRHGIHEVGGPLLAGGVSLISGRTGVFYDLEVRHALTDERLFRAHLEFRESVFRIAVPELYVAAESPVDLFRLIDSDGDLFDTRLVEHIMMRHTRHDGSSSLLREPPPAINDARSDGTTQQGLYQLLCNAQRYFAYRKLLVKLDFIQSHMVFLKEYKKSKMGTTSSVSEYENAASEKISSERSSALQRHLDRYDWMLMEQYYDRMKLRRLSRECATQAQTIGVMLVGEASFFYSAIYLSREHGRIYVLFLLLQALPMPVNPEARTLPLIKRIQGKLRSSARSSQLLALSTLAAVTTAGLFSVPLD
ncbi:unnamed protein product [Alopecurus aequalis]